MDWPVRDRFGFGQLNQLDAVRALAAEFPESAEAWSVALEFAAQMCNVDSTELLASLERDSLDRAARQASLLSKPLIVGVSGPGAVGKDTVVQNLTAHYSSIRPVVLHTTRAPRKGEEEGLNYYFVNEDRFDELDISGAFIHSRHIRGRGRYGLARKEFIFGESGTIPIVREGPRYILEISKRISEEGGGARTLIFYMLPPTPILETLCSRLVGREGIPDTLEVDRFAGTLRPYNAVHFLSAVQLYKEGGEIIFVVNDDVDRVTGIIATRVGLNPVYYEG